MTLLLSWIAKDSQKQTAAYIITDSRISWKFTNPQNGEVVHRSNWDAGRKIFHFKNYPDIVGYCGKALFPTQVISQALDLFDSGLFYNKGIDFLDRAIIFKSFIQSQLAKHPQEIDNDFQILIAGRYNKNHFFDRYILSWINKTWTEGLVKQDEDPIFQSAIILGSGSDFFKTFYKAKYSDSDIHNLSRVGPMAFSDALNQISLEIQCGGAPQIVAIYNGGHPKIIGSVFKKERFLLGCNVEENEALNNFEWRDETFQRIKGDKLELIENAQRQPPVK